MNVGSVVQIGGAVRHNPLPLLIPQNEPAIGLDDNISNRASRQKDAQQAYLGGFIGGGQLAWRVAGPTIEVVDPFNCTRQAAWTFGAILHNNNAKITCVCGIGMDTVTHVVVGIDLGPDHNRRGMVGILSLRRSRITRAFQFRNKVTNVCMITGGDKIVDPSTLASELRSCQGLLAVSTGHALLYLVDLALDLGADEITSDEVSPASFVDILVPDSESDYHRNEAISNDKHPMLCLSNSFSSNGEFKLLGPDDNVLFETPSQSVNISSLLFVPQLASLVVGYSFGAFQIINLSLITIDCASPYEEGLAPVFAFTYQEPENDPRSFVYLWVCRSLSSNPSESEENCYADRASCSLYAMNYEKKEWIEGHGLWYQSLQSMSSRFDFEASSAIAQNLHNSAPSKMFSALTVHAASKVSSSSPLAMAAADLMASSDEEADPVPELSLCMFCWEGSYLEQGRDVTQHYIAIFDINQWYQAQMPSQLRIEEDSLCPYMSFHIMDKVPKSLNEKLLSAASKMGSWSRFLSRSNNENTWFPSSLSYELHLLTSEGLVTYRCPSIQQSAISSLTVQGPGAIVNPNAAFNACIFAGIAPSDIVNSGSSTVCERKHLLDIALEHNLLSLVIQCVIEFSEGRFANVGCSLQLLLDWAWDKVRVIKESYDQLCAPLFSISFGSGVLSDSNLSRLHQHLIHLTQLCAIVGTVKDNAGQVTQESAGELEGRVQVVNLLKLYLQAVLWFYHCGLLPECEPDDVLDGKVVPFPEETIRKIYEKRRSELSQLSQDDDNLLLIDSIMSEGSSLLNEVWEKDGNPCYPPSSLHHLLSMYLLPKMSTQTKNRIIQYLFLDLASLLSDNFNTVVEELVQFPATFSMSPSIIKLTQAFWLIDQRDFETGLAVLLDPLVNPDDMTPAQHRIIIKSLLLQGQESQALTYTQIRQPPEMSLEDIRLNLTVLLANGRIREAFHYQRNNRIASNAKQLLNHVLSGCDRLGRLDSFVHLPLSPMEEEAFVKYLKTCANTASQDILLVYFLQQSRFSEISRLNDGFRKSSLCPQQKTRTTLVDSYLSHLPNVTMQMRSQPSVKTNKRMYTKPQPLSARVRHNSLAEATPLSKAKRYAIQEQNRCHAPSTSSASVPFTPFRSKAQRRKAICDWSDEVGLPSPNCSLALTDAQRDTSCLVFPTTQTASKDASDSFCGFGPGQMEASSMSFGGTSMNEFTNLQEEISKAMEDLLRKSYVTGTGKTKEKSLNKSTTTISAEMVSLLKTPPVSRKKSHPKDTSSETAPGTPQSILKVRKILQQPVTPCIELNTPESPHLNFPLQRLLLKSLTKDKSANKSATEGGSVTPKSLRFALPSRRLSVDDDNSIVIEAPAPAVVSKLQFDDDSITLKRKWGEEHPTKRTPNDKPTPRKPLPNFVPTSPATFLSYGLSDSEEEEARPAVFSSKEEEICTTEEESNSRDSFGFTPQLERNNEALDAIPISGELSTIPEATIEEEDLSLRIVRNNERIPPLQSVDEEEETEERMSVEEVKVSSSSSPTIVTNHVRKSLSPLSMRSTPKKSNDELPPPVISEEAVEAAKKVIMDLCPQNSSLNHTSFPRKNEEDNHTTSPRKDEEVDSACEESFHSVEETNSPPRVESRESESTSENDTEHLLELTKGVEEELTRGVEERTRRVSEALSLCERTESKTIFRETRVISEVYMNGEEQLVIDEEEVVEPLESEGEKYVLKFSDSEEEEGNVNLGSEEEPKEVKVNSEEETKKLAPGSEEEKNYIVEKKKEFESMNALQFSDSEEEEPPKKLDSKEEAKKMTSEREEEVNKVPLDSEEEVKKISEEEFESKYVLQFSDSEDSVDETKTELSRADTLVATKEICQVVNGPSVEGLSSLGASDLGRTISHLPSEFENIAPMFLTAKDNQVIDSVLKGSDELVNKRSPFKTIQKPTYTPKKSKNIDDIAELSSVVDDSTVPLLTFSESEEEEDDVFAQVRDEQANDSSLKEEEFHDLEEMVDEPPAETESVPATTGPSGGAELPMETSPNNNNVKKIASTEEMELPVRRSRRLSGLDSDMLPSETPSTPLRRSRRHSDVTPSKLTPQSRTRRNSSVSEALEEDASVMGTPGRRTRRNSSMSEEVLEVVKGTPGRRRNLSLMEDEEEVALPTPLLQTPPKEEVVTTPSRRGRRKAASVSSEGTPRRSSRINASQVEALEPILEDQPLPAPLAVPSTPTISSPYVASKRTPTRSSARRRSITQLDLEPIAEVSSERSQEQVSELSPLATTATPTVRSALRGGSVEPSSMAPTRSSSRRKATMGGGEINRRKSASVSPQTLRKSTPRRTRRASAVSEMKSEIEQINTELAETTSEYTTLMPDAKSYSKSVLSNALSRRKSIANHLSEVVDAEISLDFTPLKKRPHRRKASADQEDESSIIVVRKSNRKKSSPHVAYEEPEDVAEDEDAADNLAENEAKDVEESEAEDLAENPPQESSSSPSRRATRSQQSADEKKISPAVHYRLLDIPEDSKYEFPSLKKSGKALLRVKRNRLTSLSVPVDSPDRETTDLPVQKKRKTSSSSKECDTPLIITRKSTRKR